MLKNAIINTKEQRNNTSRIKDYKQNYSQESEVKFNKKNNQIKEELNSTNCFIDENLSKRRQISDEYLFNFFQKKNLNKIIIIKNYKIKKNKNTSKIGKDRYIKEKQKYIFHKSEFNINKDNFPLKKHSSKFISNNIKNDKKYYESKENEKNIFQKIIDKVKKDKKNKKKFIINKALKNKRREELLYEVNTSGNFIKSIEKKTKN